MTKIRTTISIDRELKEYVDKKNTTLSSIVNFLLRKFKKNEKIRREFKEYLFKEDQN